MKARDAALVLGLAAAAGCRQDMHDQPKYKAFRPSDFFGDDRSARPLVEDTVARGQLRADAAYFTGKQGATPVDVLPVAVTPALLRRGQQRYGIYCTPCHGYFFDVITSGFGAMPDYAAQVTVADRWAIVAYLRALQLSENARLEDVPADRRDALASPSPGPSPAPEHP